MVSTLDGGLMGLLIGIESDGTHRTVEHELLGRIVRLSDKCMSVTGARSNFNFPSCEPMDKFADMGR